MAADDRTATTPARPRRLRGTRRGVLEGFPLSILISIIIIAVGSLILIGLFEYSRSQSLGTVSVGTPLGPIHGVLPLPAPGAGTTLIVTVDSQFGGPLGGAVVTLNGSQVDTQALTSSNGSAWMWIVPVFYNHATSGVVSVTVSYAPGSSLATNTDQTYTTSFEVLD